MAARNLDPNPSAANGTTGRTIAGGTMTRPTNLTTPWIRPTATRVTTSSVNAVLQGARHNPGGSLAGRRFSAWIQWSFDRLPGTDAGPFVMAFDAAGSYIGNVAQLVRRNTGIGDAVLVGDAPANTAQIAGALYSGSSAVSGLVMTLGFIRIDDGDQPTLEPRDGSDPGWQWDGTVGNSTSTQAFSPPMGDQNAFLLLAAH